MKVKLYGWLIAMMIRAVGWTLRWDINDRAGVMDGSAKGSLILALWHNQIFGGVLFYTRKLKKRRASVLTSPSRDGDLLAAVMSNFNVGAIRGSSNKRSVAALREMVSFLREGVGKDMVITPDGPRGPVYTLESGLLKLSEWTKVPVLPMRVIYRKSISLKTWDRFRIPLPFSRVHVVLEPLQSFEGLTDREDVEVKRIALEELLKSGT